jgi:LmbE family N-acetylglucosaminyl deacetylase
MRGRKLKQESRGTEIRARLAEWKQIPESSRQSLRALARELGTSHQLLGDYLKRWEKWQSKEYRHQAEEIRARAKAENRLTTPWEQQQVHACDRAQIRALAASALLDMLARIKREAKRGPLSGWQIKMLKILAHAGFPEAQALLQKCSQTSAKNQKNNLPPIPSGAAKSFRPA